MKSAVTNARKNRPTAAAPDHAQTRWKVIWCIWSPPASTPLRHRSPCPRTRTILLVQALRRGDCIAARRLAVALAADDPTALPAAAVAGRGRGRDRGRDDHRLDARRDGI